MPSVPRSKRHLMLCSRSAAAASPSSPYSLPILSATSTSSSSASLELGANDNAILGTPLEVHNQQEEEAMELVVEKAATTVQVESTTSATAAINVFSSSHCPISTPTPTATSTGNFKQQCNSSPYKKSDKTASTTAASSSSVLLQSCRRQKFNKTKKQLPDLSSLLTCNDVAVQVFAFFKNDARNLVYDLGLPISMDAPSLQALTANDNSNCNCSLIDKNTLKCYRLVTQEFSGSLLVSFEEQHKRPTMVEVYRKQTLVAHSGQELRLRIQNNKNSMSNNEHVSLGADVSTMGTRPMQYCLLWSSSEDMGNTFYCLYPNNYQQQQQFATLEPNSEILLSVPVTGESNSSMRMLLLCYSATENSTTDSAYESFTCILNMAQEHQRLQQGGVHVTSVNQQTKLQGNVIVYDYVVKIIQEEESIDASSVFFQSE